MTDDLDPLDHALHRRRVADLEAEVARFAALLDAIRALTGPPYNPRLVRIGRMIETQQRSKP